MNETSIEWADFTSNPIKFRDASGKTKWACAKVSPGCANCYSETLAKRYGRGGPFSLPVLQELTPFFDDEEARLILRSKKITGKKIFIGDMTDIFGDWVSVAILDQLFEIFERRPDVTFQILTKRADKMSAYMRSRPGGSVTHCKAPPKNVWLGVSVENQEWADKRIQHLRATPAAVRFLSVEPMIGPVDLTAYQNIDWVIVGGESGPRARPCQLGWIASVVGQCADAEVPCFVKQLGSKPFSIAHRISFRGNKEKKPNGFYRYLNDRKGGDMAEWPEEIRVRQFPKEAPNGKD